MAETEWLKWDSAVPFEGGVMTENLGIRVDSKHGSICLLVEGEL